MAPTGRARGPRPPGSTPVPTDIAIVRRFGGRSQGGAVFVGCAENVTALARVIAETAHELADQAHEPRARPSRTVQESSTSRTAVCCAQADSVLWKIGRTGGQVPSNTVSHSGIRLPDATGASDG